jgi:hypothetical protein
VLNLTEIQRGTAEAFGVVVLGATSFFFVVRLLPAPSAELLRDIGNLGLGLLLAYVVESVWLASRMRGSSDYRSRLGAFFGLGMSGLVGAIVSILLAAHRDAGHANLLDQLGLSWAAVSLVILGGMVVVQPLLVHEWSDE